MRLNTKMYTRSLLALWLAFASATFAEETVSPPPPPPMPPVGPLVIPKSAAEAIHLIEKFGDSWINAQKEILLDNWLRNDEKDPNSFSGAIIASKSAGRPPSGKDPGEPNYRYHWIRDSAIVAMAAASQYFYEKDPKEKERYAKALSAYVGFSRAAQELPITHEWMVYRDGRPDFNAGPDTPGAFAVRYGEAKYEVERKEVFDADGRKRTILVPGDYKGPWGRPQNDGPALRAIAMTEVLKVMKAEMRRKRGQSVKGEEETISRAAKVLLEDLRYTRALWQHPSYDVWEEVFASHFFNRVVQSEAIEKGLAALRQMGVKLDPAEEQGFKDTRKAIESSLSDFEKDGEIMAFIDNRNGGPPRSTTRDMTVIFAALRRRNQKYSAGDPVIQATAMNLIDSFRNDPRFSDQPGEEKPGIPIGRYPDDAWNGHERVQDAKGNYVSAGHPWVITTLAMDEFFLRVATEIHQQGEVVINGLNRRFFEYVYGGAENLPADWQLALNRGGEVRYRIASDPLKTTTLFDNFKFRAAEFAARLIASGVDPHFETPEQFMLVPREPGKPESSHVGARGLTWNSAKMIEVRDCYRELTKLVPNRPNQMIGFFK